MIVGPNNSYKKYLELNFFSKIFLRGEHVKNESILLVF
jgi:hypothetical protein